MILFMGGGIPACLGAGLGGGGGIPACLAGFQAHTQGGSLGGSGQGSLQAHNQGGSWGASGPGPHPRGKLRGIWSRAIPKGEVEGWSGQGGACPWGGEGVPALGEYLLQGGVCSRGCLLWGVWRHPQDSYCCGWYAYYWNAFLFHV